MVSTWSGDGHFHASYRTHPSQKPHRNHSQATVPHIPGEAADRRRDVGRGGIRGADRAGAIYSLIGTAKLNGLDPKAYLREVLTRIADHPISRISELLPWTILSAVEVST